VRQSPKQPGSLAALSRREHAVAAKFAEGLTYRQIAERLFISPKTVRTHLESIYEKLHIGNKLALSRIFAEAALSTRPSIAVLPFDNLSGDPEQRYFSDGVTEDIITELTRFRGLSVIARNVSFQYRGGAVSLQQIGRELGARYIVQGSVRKSGDRVRITAHLLDAGTGVQLWADRLDSTSADIFAAQDEVARSVVSVVPGRIEEAMVASSRRKPVGGLTAYDLLLRGESHLMSSGFGDKNAFAMFRRVLKLDPNCGRAHCRIADMYSYNVFRWGVPREEALARARHHIEQALVLDEADALTHANAGRMYLVSGVYDLAASHAEHAIVLNPNDWFAITQAGGVVNYLGDHRQGIERILKTLRLDPYHPATRLETLFDACYMACEYEKAIDAFERWPSPPPHMWAEVSACHAQLGQMEEACKARRHYELMRPEGFAFDEYAAAHIALCKHQKDRDHWLDGYRMANLPV
jgi:adenylate cyclase